MGYGRLRLDSGGLRQSSHSVRERSSGWRILWSLLALYTREATEAMKDSGDSMRTTCASSGQKGPQEFPRLATAYGRILAERHVYSDDTPKNPSCRHCCACFLNYCGTDSHSSPDGTHVFLLSRTSPWSADCICST